MVRVSAKPSLCHLSERWHRAPRRWGHPIHSLSSYLAMFPPTIPHVFIRWLTQPGDVVFDPFSGRGTCPFEAGLLGRRGFGSDANPLAWLLTAAKVQPPTPEALYERLSELHRLAADDEPRDVPDDIRMLFAPRTLARLLWLRKELDRTQPADRFLLAVLTGSLHANANTDGSARGLTVPMPNTFAMSPGYVRRYIAEHDLKAPEVDPLEFIQGRLPRFPLPVDGFARGRAWSQDATERISWPTGYRHAALAFTSPPYLDVVRYGKYNWIRLWLLGEEARELDLKLFSSSSVDRYLAFMTEVIQQLQRVVRRDGYVCLVIGDVRRPDRSVNLAELVVNECTAPTGLTHIGTVVDRLPSQHKVSRIWGTARGRATKTDRILVLARPDAPEPGALNRIRWGGREAWQPSSKN